MGESLVGKRFGEFTVLYKYSDDKYGIKYMCECSCGSKYVISDKKLLSGDVTFCGNKTRHLGHSPLFKNLTGKRFGKLTVLGIDHKDGYKTFYKCKCDCGNTSVVDGTALTRKNNPIKSCGCIVGGHKNFKDLTGKKFNSLTVLKLDHMSSHAYWLCRCDCGNTCVVSGSKLISGHTKSCGCASKLANVKDKVGMRFGKLVVKSYAGDSSWNVHCDCGKDFIATTANLDNGMTSCGCYSKAVHGSQAENDVKEFVESLVGKQNVDKGKYLDFNSKQEIDMLMSKYRLGIEYNGSAFHASLNSIYNDKPKLYHQAKFLQAKKQGIHLISLFDVDWLYNQSRVKEYIKSLLTGNIRIFARKCNLRGIDKKIAHDFCNSYHLQGQARIDSICYGLYYDDDLVEVMTFGKLRLKKQQEGHYELHRLCTKSGVTVVGGASRLLKAFEREYNPLNLLSYSNNDYFTGNIYPTLGFDYIKQVAPPYYWFYNNIEYKREKCQVKKLRVLYPSLVKEAEDKKVGIEDYVMVKLGARKVYRSGNTRWEKHYEKYN